MELPALEFVQFMPNPHDLATGTGVAPGTDSQAIGQGWRVDHQAMVASRDERGLDSAEEPFPVMMDRVGLTVHQQRSSNDVGSERLSDRLMSQAHT